MGEDVRGVVFLEDAEGVDEADRAEKGEERADKHEY